VKRARAPSTKLRPVKRAHVRAAARAVFAGSCADEIEHSRGPRSPVRREERLGEQAAGLQRKTRATALSARCDGAEPLVVCGANRDVVTALGEIARGRARLDEPRDEDL
jgi:hypothetical protein